MAKTFAPRVLKKDRQRIDPTEVLGSDVFAVSDNKLFQGAKVQEIELKEIRVLGQVRTKFDDKSIRDLAENIQINGLIQPLVLHKDRDGRYR
ncbi:MAG: hypothetical protein A2451_02435 [Bdellovibrionales bacterium RIFOXYC2_FULL_39_8]|nr:MAG: hypothetical protein A2451_02435 [Bdellovibrionales bacterium RIFOXYC2_FULL_39_8]